MCIPSFPLNKYFINPDISARYKNQLPAQALAKHEEHGGDIFRIEDDIHINVPTFVAQRLPLHSAIFHMVLQYFLHGRAAMNLAMIQYLRESSARAHKEIATREQEIQILNEELKRVPSHQKVLHEQLRKRIDDKQEALNTDALSQGSTLELTCIRQSDVEVLHESLHENRVQVHLVTLNLLHILGLEKRPTEDPLVPLEIRSRQGKLAFTFNLKQGVLNSLSALECEQALPHVMQGLSGVYAGIFGLMVEHRNAHQLSAGACYFTRKNRAGEHLSPKLLLRMLGYHEKSSSSAHMLRLQVAILRCITITGSQGSKKFAHTPLLEEHEKHVEASALPEGVRTGRWSILTVPSPILDAQQKQFTQVPRSLLLCHKPWIVNVGLQLKSLEALNHTTDELNVQIGRLIHDSGLRQLFRADSSRDRDKLARAFSELEELGLVSGLMNKASEQLTSEQIPGQQLELPLLTPTSHPTTKPTLVISAHPPRRRHTQASQHQTIRVMLYQRHLYTPDTQQDDDAQTHLPLNTQL